MTFEEFKTACKEGIEDAKNADLLEEGSFWEVYGLINGMIFAAKQFLSVRYSNDVNELAAELRIIVRNERRNQIKENKKKNLPTPTQ